jgi:hypothetical protein
VISLSNLWAIIGAHFSAGSASSEKSTDTRMNQGLMSAWAISSTIFESNVSLLELGYFYS